jgi:Putative prokaryotic signal transducing protein
MFCPKCKSEYREGFSVCADCNVELIEELPPEKEPEFIEYEEILGTYNPADIMIIKSILDAENITYYFNAEHFMYVRPMAEPARLMVAKEDVETAKEIVKDLDLSVIAINLKKDDENT